MASPNMTWSSSAGTPGMMRSRSWSGSGQINIQFFFFLTPFLSGFKHDCPSGRLKKEKVLEIYSVLMPDGDASVFVDQIFRIFDKDENGSIDFNVIFLKKKFT